MAAPNPPLSPTRVDELVDQIAASALKLKACQKLVESTGGDASVPAVPAVLSQELRAHRQKLVEASWQLHHEALGPREYILNLSVQMNYIACLKWLCRYKVFAHIPTTAPISYTALAALTSSHQGTLKSVARMAMTSGLLAEPTANHVSHTPVSLILSTEPNFLLWAEFMAEVGVPTAASFADATQRWPGSLKNTETSYNVAFDTPLPLFEHLRAVPAQTERFAGYMKSVTNAEGTNLRHLVSGYDWAGLKEGSLVVDVGGSTGHGSVAVAEAHPGLRFVVQDLAANAEAGRAALADKEEVAGRVSFQAHDFFDEQPVRGADAYLLRMIVHDWSDDDSVRILGRVVKAMEHNKRASLLIMDSVLPLPGELPATQERLLRLRDLTMRQVFNSRERAPEEWTALLARVDPRLRLVRSTKPEGSVLAVMEWKFEDAEVEGMLEVKVEEDVAVARTEVRA